MVKENTVIIMGNFEIKWMLIFWHLQHRVSINGRCGIIDHLIGPLVLLARLTREAYLKFLENILPELLEDIPLDVRT